MKIGQACAQNTSTRVSGHAFHRFPILGQTDGLTGYPCGVYVDYHPDPDGRVDTGRQADVQCHKYSAAAWDPHTNRNINKLEMVRRSAVCYVDHNYERIPGTVTALLKKYGLDTLKSRRLFQRLCIMYKIANDLVDIPQHIHLKPAQTRTRGSHQHKYLLPPARTNCMKYLYFPRTVKDRDILSNEVVTAPSLDSIKERL